MLQLVTTMPVSDASLLYTCQLCYCE